MEISKEIKTNFLNNKNMAMVNLMYTANWFRDLNKNILKKYNLLPQHYNVLRIVKGKYPDASCPSDIKSVMLDKGPDITRLIDKLVSMGYIERCLNQSNRRSMDIRISDKGTHVLKEMTQLMEAVRDQHFGLSEEEALTLSQLLDKARL
ncbi:MarR family transcriptional regulator [Reichenbachiella agarivorans]|uniref:MarR family transcriptional regulator n=1 Tax=Reichenbachiella agarivorans TaxID=2979464 RepID=A0ABY6CSM0_9BACT|nr:MarR family transcriptional regulator [Reichenbachiella agarivorans]UXP33521.1 MarR family transcriptional regulator [Reichenbachiella agarivorans]